MKDFIVQSPEIRIDNRILQSDEVRIMETGYSSAKKHHFEIEGYDQSFLDSQKFPDSMRVIQEFY